MDVQIKSDALDRYFGSIHRTGKGDPGDLALDTSCLLTGNLWMTKDHVGWHQEGLKQNESAWPGDMYPTNTNPLVGIIAGSMCKLLPQIVNQSELQSGWRGAAIVAIHKEARESSWEM